MKRTTIACVVALSAASVGVFAPVAHAQDVSDWSGFYAGVNVGGGFGSTDWSGIIVPSAPGQNYNSKFSTSHPNGAVGGVHVGYNFQYDPMFLIGVEGGVSASGLQDGDTCFGSPSYGDYSANCHTKVDWMADLAVRIGITSLDRLMLYGKVGGTYAQAQFQAIGPVSNSGGYASTSDDRFGYVVGVGAEYALNKKWTLGVEYDYRNYGTSRVSFTPTGVQNNFNPPFSAETSLSVNTFVARMSYRF